MLTRQWCDALDFLRCYVNTWVMLRSWLSSVLCYDISDVALLTFFVVMLTRQWCDALDLLRCYVHTWVMLRSWLSSVLCSRRQWCYVASFLWGETLRKKKKLKNIQVLAAASLHRQPGRKAILNAMTVYRKDCLAGIVKLSPSDAFKVAKLHWMSWNTRKKSWRVVRWRFATFFHWKFPEIMTKPPVLSSFSRRRDSGFARNYI